MDLKEFYKDSLVLTCDFQFVCTLVKWIVNNLTPRQRQNTEVVSSGCPIAGGRDAQMNSSLFLPFIPALYIRSSDIQLSNKVWNLGEISRLLISIWVWELCVPSGFVVYSVPHTNSHTKPELSGRLWDRTEHFIVALPSPPHPHVPPFQPPLPLNTV